MAAIAIQTLQSQHVGFLLLSPNATDEASGREMGDCIFRSLPMQCEVFEHELAERIFGYQQRGEFEYRRHTSDDQTTIEVAIEPDQFIRFLLDASGAGSISHSSAGLQTPIGLAQLARPK